MSHEVNELFASISRPNPVETNYTIANIEGEIPRELNGTLYRNGPNQKTIFMPLEASSVIASIGGITEIAREAFGRGAQRPDGDG